jgi:hypothetical protein
MDKFLQCSTPCLFQCYFPEMTKVAGLVMFISILSVYCELVIVANDGYQLSRLCQNTLLSRSHLDQMPSPVGLMCSRIANRRIGD